MSDVTLERAIPVCTAGPDGGAVDPRPPGWEPALRGVSGSSRPINVPLPELAAVQGWVGDLEADLTEPPTAADKSILASLARLALLELRLSRSVFVKGAIRKTGDVRPAVVELRQVVRLKADLLARLSFKRGPKPVQDIRDLWQSGDGGHDGPDRVGSGPLAEVDADRPASPERDAAGPGSTAGRVEGER